MTMKHWNPPETAPKDGKIFLITTAGPQIDIAWWDGECFRDYYYQQRILNQWPFMIGWKLIEAPAEVGNSQTESRNLNGFTSLDDNFAINATKSTASWTEGNRT